jgi:hypothetical protein
MVAGRNPFLFLKHRFHILHFPNSTGLFTKPTGRHYTKHRFSPDIAPNQSPTLGAHTHAHAHGCWVGMGAMLLFMGGHGWASVLCIHVSNSKSESNFSDAENTLTKNRSGSKPTILNDLLFVRSNQDWCRRTHYIILNTWAQFE